MNNLIVKLKQFDKEVNSIITEPELQKLFSQLAPVFLYGGYIQVREDFKVYIRTVEFYFHSEKKHGLHDPIVYHRDKRDTSGDVLMEIPYFPLMTLHAHASGYDITFENKQGEYRASALIRSYEVKDREERYLTWNSEQRMFMQSEKYGYNTQSTYLYDLLNGFSLGKRNKIVWVDSPTTPTTKPTEKARQNVFLSDNEFIYRKIDGKRCKRQWSFTREDQI